MSARSLICTLLILCLVAGSSLADVVVLRSGERLVGTIANRESIRADPNSVDAVSILIAGSGELRRLPASQLEYLIFEDAGAQQVIDLLSRPKEEPKIASQPGPSRHSIAGGTLAIALGVAMIGVGAFHKFGGPICKVSKSSIECHESSYNWDNYALFGGGAIVAIIGVAELTLGAERDYTTGTRTHSAQPIVLLSSRGSPTRVAIAYRYAF